MITQYMGKSEEEKLDDDKEHLEGIEDGAGCVEIWERLSEQREEE